MQVKFYFYFIIFWATTLTSQRDGTQSCIASFKPLYCCCCGLDLSSFRNFQLYKHNFKLNKLIIYSNLITYRPRLVVVNNNFQACKLCSLAY